jgi:hypothetical protein
LSGLPKNDALPPSSRLHAPATRFFLDRTNQPSDNHSIYMKLSEQQLNFFKIFGYLGFPQLFSKVEIEEIASRFEQTIDRFGGGTNHDGSRRTMMGAPIEHLPEMCALLDDPRITGIIGGILGEDFTYCGGDGNYYSGDTGWHPDGNGNILNPIKVAFYLDPVGPDTGCLRVIPGSFEKEHLINRRKINPNESEKLFGIHRRDFPGNVPLTCTPGDIVMFNHDVWHAAYGGSSRRRMFTLNCHRRANTPEEFQALKDWLDLHAFGNGSRVAQAPKKLFTETMLSTASPERMRHLEQGLQAYDELYAGYQAEAPGSRNIPQTVSA